MKEEIKLRGLVSDLRDCLERGRGTPCFVPPKTQKR